MTFREPRSLWVPPWHLGYVVRVIIRLDQLLDPVGPAVSSGARHFLPVGALTGLGCDLGTRVIDLQEC